MLLKFSSKILVQVLPFFMALAFEALQLCPDLITCSSAEHGCKRKTHTGALAQGYCHLFIEAPLGGSTAARRIWSLEVCVKKKSLGESDCSSRRLYGFVLGFVLGNISDFRSELAEDLARIMLGAGGVWGRAAPPARAAENIRQNMPRM